MSHDEQAARPRLPRAIWALGFTSMLMDVSSETIHALLPVYLTTVLGLSAAAIGVIEGLAEATTLAVKIFSGAISDWLGRRKLPALIGYGLAAATKPVFALAVGPALVVAAHIVDRFGKGIRGAPRDALIADLTPPEQRGAAFGLRQSLDTIGGIVGPLAAVGLMLASSDNFRFVFALAIIPAILSVGTLLVFVPSDGATPRAAEFPLSRAAARQMPRAFWIVVTLGAAMAAVRVAEAFLVLRATGFGLDPAWAPLVLVVMSVVYGALAYPAGARFQIAFRRAPWWSRRSRSSALPRSSSRSLRRCPCFSVASRSGARIWRCRRACSPSWSRTPRRRLCAERRSACSTSRARWRWWSEIRRSDFCGRRRAPLRPMRWRPARPCS